MIDLYLVVIAIGLIFCSFPVYSLIRSKFSDIKGSFEPIKEEPDNFEQEIIDFETDNVQYWLNASKGMWGEYQEEIKKKNEQIH